MSQPSPVPPAPQPQQPFVYPPSIKVAICIPAQQQVDIRWAFTLPKIFQQVPPNSQVFTDWRYGLAETRETLFHTAIKSLPDLTHILWVDTDTIPNDNVIPQLILDNKPIISAIYFNSLFTGINAWKDEKPLDLKNPVLQKDPIVEVDKIGMGICVMQKNVYDALVDEEKPLFYYKVDIGTQQLLSEDFYFFQKAAKHGIKPWVDVRCQALHIKNCAINPDGSIQTPFVQQQK